MTRDQETEPTRENLFTVLDLIVAEFESDPMSVQCFDLRTVNRAISLVERYKSSVEKKDD